MTDLLQKFEKEQIEKLTFKKRIPAFRPGDTLKVTVKIIEGERTRFQAFEGICIARKNNSINSKFTVRKISHGEGVERVFPLFSPIIDKIEVVRKGDVRRAKLYYLRSRSGKSARITDSDRGDEIDQYALTENSEVSSDETQEVAEETTKMKTIPIEEATKSKDNLVKEESLTEPVNETVVEEKKSMEEKSESTASEADKTNDEKKSHT